MEGRRDSTISFISCQSSEDVAQSGSSGTAPVERVATSEEELGKVLKWICGFDWLSKSNDSSCHKRVVADDSAADVIRLRRSEFDAEIPPMIPKTINFDTVEVVVRMIIRKAAKEGDVMKVPEQLASIHRRAQLSEIKRRRSVNRSLVQLTSTFGQKETDLNHSLAQFRIMLCRFGLTLFLSPECLDLDPTPPNESETARAVNKLILCDGMDFMNGMLSVAGEDKLTDEFATKLIKPVIAQLYIDLQGRRLCDLKTSSMSIISNFIRTPVFAKLLVESPFFNTYTAAHARGPSGGWSMMLQSFFGRLFRPTPLDHLVVGDEGPSFVSALDRHFVSCTSLPVVSQNLNLVRVGWQQVVSQHVQILKSLCKHGGTIRHETLKWFKDFIYANKTMSTLQFRQLQEAFGQAEVLIARAQGTCTIGFAFNVLVLLLELCEPISISKANELQILYPQISKLTEIGEKTCYLHEAMSDASCFGEECKIKEFQSLITAASQDEIKFVSHIFWLSASATHTFFLPVLLSHEENQMRLGRSSESRAAEKVFREELCWLSILKSDLFIHSFSHFCELALVILLRSIFCYDQCGMPLEYSASEKCPHPVLAALGLNKSLRAGANPSPQFLCLPSAYFTDLLSGLSRYMKAIYASNRLHQDNVHFVEGLVPINFREILAALIIFLLTDQGAYFHPSLKYDALNQQLIASALIDEFACLLDKTYAMQHFLPSSLMLGFIDAHKMSYYQRFEMRFWLTRHLDRALKDSHYKKMVREFETQQPAAYEKFIHYFASDTSYVLEEGLSALAQIKENEDKGTQPAQERENQVQVESMVDGTHNVAAMPREQLVQHCQSMMEGGMVSLQVLARLVELSAPFIIASEVIKDQLILYLNGCLNSLVGPKCLRLKVSSFEEYNFKPRNFLAILCQSYIKLAELNEKDIHSLAATISSEGRYYSDQLFAKAVKILRREAILDHKSIERFSDLTKLCAEKRQALERNQGDAIDINSVPDEFIDPIMSEIMSDPVRLPSSGVIVDRKVIERHLMSEAFDPFNRAPLSRDDLVPEEELKKQIMAFLKDQQNSQ